MSKKEEKVVINKNTIPHLPIGVHRYEPGLYVRVTPTSRYWILKYTINGKRREAGLGPAVGQAISAVTAKMHQYRALILQGIDPVEKAKEKREAQKEALRQERIKNSMPTFEQFAPEAFERIREVRVFSSKKTEQTWQYIINELCRTDIAKRKIDTITRDDIVRVLKPLWTTLSRKAQLMQSCLNGIFNVAKAQDLIVKNPAEWKGGLDAFLSPMSKVRNTIVPTKHHAALSAEDLRELVQKLWEKDEIHAMAIIFGALTVGRASEYLLGRWDEVDLSNKTFSVPKERRKDRKDVPHVNPLSHQAVALLNRLDTSSDFLFSNAKGTGTITESYTLRFMKRFTDKPVTLHGVRSTFSDWCAHNEKNFLVSEKCLMHAVGNVVFRSYQRDDLLDQRRVLMQEWADYLLPNVK